jgi:sulfur carrier protein ThiS
MKNTPRYDVPTVSVFLQPEDMKLSLPRPKNAQQLLKALGLRSCTALVAREGELLTPDRAIYPGDQLLVRKVTSSG